MLDEDQAPDIAGKESVSVADHSDHLVKLHVNQSSNSQAWTKFMIVIQGSFASALGYILLLKEQPPIAIRVTLCLIIALFGVSTSIVIRIIIKRHHQWAAWYVNKYGMLPGNHGLVYPVPERPFAATSIRDVDPGYIGKALVVFCTGVAVFWFAVAVVVIFLAIP
jgi:hypothetical protein